MTGARVWSVSRKTFLDMSALHDTHLLNAFAKLERGQYTEPPDADDPLVLGAVVPERYVELVTAFLAEMGKRRIGRFAPAEPSEEGFA